MANPDSMGEMLTGQGSSGATVPGNQRGVRNAREMRARSVRSYNIPPPMARSARSNSFQTDIDSVGGFQRKATNFIRGSGRINTQKEIKPVKSSAKLSFQRLH